MSNSKKSFRENNPAMQFITPGTLPEAGQQTGSAPRPAAPAAAPKRETKSKRLNLLIQPSLHEDLLKIAYVQRVSLNELILRAAREYAAQNQDAIRKYNEFTGE